MQLEDMATAPTARRFRARRQAAAFDPTKYPRSLELLEAWKAGAEWQDMAKTFRLSQCAARQVVMALADKTERNRVNDIRRKLAQERDRAKRAAGEGGRTARPRWFESRIKCPSVLEFIRRLEASTTAELQRGLARGEQGGEGEDE